MKLISFEEHYKEMNRVFDMSFKWVPRFHMLAVIGCLVAYFVIDGAELIYALYIPLDILFSVGKEAFFWVYFGIDMNEKKDEERLRIRE